MQIGGSNEQVFFSLSNYQLIGRTYTTCFRHGPNAKKKKVAANPPDDMKQIFKSIVRK